MNRRLLAGAASLSLAAAVLVGIPSAAQGTGPPADGTFVRVTDTGRIYRLAGGAPVYVSSWAPFGGPRPAVAVPAGELQRWGLYPADGTFVRTVPDGTVYRFAGGAPIHVGAWAAFGGPRPAVDIDRNAVELAEADGASEPWNHVRREPAEGTFIRGAQTGYTYRVTASAPLAFGQEALRIANVPVKGVRRPVTDVDQTAIDQAGNPGPSAHLRRLPSGFLRVLQTGRIYVVDDEGTPRPVPSWEPYGGPHPTLLVDQAAIDHAGEQRPYDHLSNTPLPAFLWPARQRVEATVGTRVQFDLRDPGGVILAAFRPQLSVEGALPDGLQLRTTDGTPWAHLSGTPGRAGTWVLPLVVTDVLARTVRMELTVVVHPVPVGRTGPLAADEIRWVDVTPEGNSPGHALHPIAVSGDGDTVVLAGAAAAELVPGRDTGKARIVARQLSTGRSELVDVATDGTPADLPDLDDCCDNAAVSADGNRVVFLSRATNLAGVPDGVGRADVFVRDRAAGTTTLVSATPEGLPAEESSDWPSMSADGRYVAFSSVAGNLVAGDDNGQSDVFVRDLETGVTRLASVNATGVASRTGSSGRPRLSADGRYVAFLTSATDLTPEHGSAEIAVRDLVLGSTVYADAFQDTFLNSLTTYAFSADGSTVAALHYQHGPVPVMNVRTGERWWASGQPVGGVPLVAGGYPAWLALSADGRQVFFSSYAGHLDGVDLGENKECQPFEPGIPPVCSYYDTFLYRYDLDTHQARILNPGSVSGVRRTIDAIAAANASTIAFVPAAADADRSPVLVRRVG